MAAAASLAPVAGVHLCRSESLETSLRGEPYAVKVIDNPQPRIAVYLPTGASGSAELRLAALDADRCKVAKLQQTFKVPGGLSRAVELSVELELLSPRVCTLSVTIAPSADAGRVVSEPQGIDCGQGRTACEADFPPLAVKVSPVSGTRATSTFSGTCAGPADACLTTLTQPQQLQVSFAPLTNCSSEGWCQVSTSIPNNLRALAPLGIGHIIAVGDNGAIMRCGGGICTQLGIQGASSLPNLTSAWGSDAGDIYAVGGGNLRIMCQAGFSICKSNTFATVSAFNAVWGSDANNIYLVGNSGTGLKCPSDPTASCPNLNIKPSTTASLKMIQGNASGQFYIVGDSGSVLRGTGGSTELFNISTNSAQGLTSAWVSATGIAYAVGGTDWNVLRCTNVCDPTTTGSGATFTGVWGPDRTEERVYVVGSAGIIRRWSPGSGMGTPLVSPPLTAQTLNAVWGTRQEVVYAVGNAGTIVRCMTGPDNCMRQMLPAGGVLNPNLNAVRASGAGHLYAVGDAGTVLRLVP